MEPWVVSSPREALALGAAKGLLAGAFLASGGLKLARHAKLTGNFARWGYPAWFMTAVGAGLIPAATARAAAAALALLMVGAAGTHLRHREFLAAIPALVLLALLAVVLALRLPA